MKLEKRAGHTAPDKDMILRNAPDCFVILLLNAHVHSLLTQTQHAHAGSRGQAKMGGAEHPRDEQLLAVHVSVGF